MSADTLSLPEGTVTVLSTDLVGSTLLNQRLGDEAATAVERELAALAQEQVQKQRGVVVGVYLEVALRMTEQVELLWNYDLFQNAIYAALDD